MIKFTQKQLKEKECLEWFNENLLKKYPPQEGEFEEYLAHSERGVPIKGFKRGYQVFNIYSVCKEWRGRFCDSNENNRAIYEEGILEGTMPYFTILGGENKKEIPPRSAVDYLKNSLFKGIDSELIKNVYQMILKEYAS